MASIWDMLFSGGGQAPQFADPNGNPNAQLPVPFPGPQQAPWLPQTTPWPQDAAPLTAQQRYRAAQAGDESRMPSFQRSGPTLPGMIAQSMADTGRMMTTAPPAMPRGAYMDAGGPAQGTADPQAFADWLGEMRQRGDLAPSMALGMIGGGTAFAPRSALGSAGAKMLQPAAEATAEAAQPGIRAYHGSPHDFTQFDLSKIGTGEGAQAYGHGLYFAENEGVATEYRRALAGGSEKLIGGELYDSSKPQHLAASLVNTFKNSENPRQTALSSLQADIANPNLTTTARQHYQSTADILASSQNLPEVTQKPRGHMYEVNIGAHPEQFLDWDKPLSEQSEYVHSLFQQPAPSQGLAHAGAGNAEVLGGFGQGPSAVDQANRFASIPSGGVVSQRMGSVVDNSKIGNPVVGLNPVDVVNILRGQQGAANVSGHDASMLLSELPVHGGNNVPLGVGGTSSPKGSIASGAAEGFGVSGDIMGRSVKGLPAFTADDLRHMTVPQLLERLGSRDAATNVLRDQGVAGIRYLDQGSRLPDATLQRHLDNARSTLSIAEHTKDPALIAEHQANVERLEAKMNAPKSSNYVVFDPKMIEIMRKYGIAGLLSSGAASQLPIPPQKAPVF